MHTKVLLAMMKIDAHQHFWRYTPEEFPWIDDSMSVLQQDFLVPQSQEQLNAHQFDTAIAVQARPLLEENNWLLSLAQNTSSILAVIGWVDLFSKDAPEQIMEYLSKPKCKGFRAMLQDMDNAEAAMQDPLFNQNIACLQAQGGIYEILLRNDQLGQLSAFCRKHDEAPLIIDHVAKPMYEEGLESATGQNWLQEITAVSQYPHVYIKISGLISELTERHRNSPEQWPAVFEPFLHCVLELFGSSRLIFGSDWPVCALNGSYKQSVSVVSDWAQSCLSENEHAQLFGLTAQSVYAGR